MFGFPGPRPVVRAFSLYLIVTALPASGQETLRQDHNRFYRVGSILDINEVVGLDKVKEGRAAEVAIELELDYLGDWYLDKLRSRLHPPVPFFPGNKRHLASQRFLVGERLTAFFHEIKSFRRACELVERPRLRELAEVMLLAGAPSSPRTCA